MVMKEQRPDRIPSFMWIVLLVVILVSALYSIPKTIGVYRGSELQEMVREYRMQKENTSGNQVVLYQAQLYYLSPEQNGTLILLGRKTETAVQQGLDGLVQQLLEGPTLEDLSEGLVTLIPFGTTLLGSSVVRGVAYIELSKEFQVPGSFGKEGTELACRQITMTAKSLSYIQECVILIDGSPFYYDTEL